MAQIGAQKLYNTARAGNGPMLLFMLSCPENVARYSLDKLWQAIRSGSDPQSCYINLARGGGDVARKSRTALEDRITAGVEQTSTVDVIETALNKFFALYEGELYERTPHQWLKFVTLAANVPDDNALLRVLRTVSRHGDYDMDSEDNVMDYLYSTHIARGWGDKRPVNRERCGQLIRAVIDFGTNDVGFKDAGSSLPYTMVANDFNDEVAYLFDQREQASFLNGNQRKMFNMLSPTAKQRMLAGPTKNDDSEQDDDE